MRDTLSAIEYPGDWDEADDNHPESTVAVHEDAAELVVWETDTGGVTVNLIQSLESDGYEVDVTSHAAQYTPGDEQELLSYVTTLLEDYDSGDEIVEPVAIVGHDGDIESITLDHILDEDIPLIDPTNTPPLADVLVIYPSYLPDRTTVEDVLEVRRELVAAVYGFTSDMDALRVLESESEAYGSMTAEMFSVSEHSLTRLSQDDS